MFKKIISLTLLITLLTSPAYAATKPDNYTEPDKFLSGYFIGSDKSEKEKQVQGQDKQKQVESILAIIKALHPDWESSYQYGTFDCSEMTEYLKYFFQKCGLKSDYCQSNGFWHCWLEVPLNQNNSDKLLIEPTTLKIVPKSEWEQNYYRHRDVTWNRFMEPNEIDWWNSFPFPMTPH